MARISGAWYVIAPVLAAFVLVALHQASPAAAGTLTGVRDYLNHQLENQTSGERHQIFFVPATNLPGSSNTVDLIFPDTPDGTWCAAAGNDLSVQGISDPEGQTESATILPGSLAAVCVQGSGSGSADTITISHVGPLVAGTKYGVTVSDGAVATLGTPTAGQGLILNLRTTNGTSTVDSLQFYASIIGSDQVVITATVVGGGPPANPTVEFRGLAAPQAAITVARDSVQVTAATAADDATFDIPLGNQPVGQHVYTVAGIDASGHPLTELTFALNLAAGNTTIITGVFLGPSIAVDKTAVKLGQPITVFGTTAPKSLVTLSIGSVHAESLNLQSNTSGFWSRAVDTTPLGVGSHSAQAQAMTSDNVISAASSSVTFAVNPLEKCDGKKSADLNCDGGVNLTDFSILLFFWKATNPTNARADINHDGSVNVVDFSIML
ncbi:hypothetical protein HY091_02710, partial [Candidatus Kaiserbacteria bacterium]|nr:hypothetical protein [Candidatus Kaiserbacteria bacterium]